MVCAIRTALFAPDFALYPSGRTPFSEVCQHAIKTVLFLYQKVDDEHF
jgi:hypothetical protein